VARSKWVEYLCGPVRRRRAAREYEQPHVREARAPVAQVRHAEHARLQALADRVQRGREGAVVADLTGAGTGGVDTRDVVKVLRQYSIVLHTPALLAGRLPVSQPARARYARPMSRFGGSQPDLFAAPAPEAVPETPKDPLAELAALLARVRGAERPPWPDAAAAVAEEHRALGLARRAGPEGEALAAAFLAETERLLALTD
jgi:hypothetical protein